MSDMYSRAKLSESLPSIHHLQQRERSQLILRRKGKTMQEEE
jgi:hypothetical protein